MNGYRPGSPGVKRLAPAMGKSGLLSRRYLPKRYGLVNRRVPFVAEAVYPEHPNPCAAITNNRYPTDGVLHRSQQLHEIVGV